MQTALVEVPRGKDDHTDDDEREEDPEYGAVRLRTRAAVLLAVVDAVSSLARRVRDPAVRRALVPELLVTHACRVIRQRCCTW